MFEVPWKLTVLQLTTYNYAYITREGAAAEQGMQTASVYNPILILQIIEHWSIYNVLWFTSWSKGTDFLTLKSLPTDQNETEEYW